jgi:hypothetical protein
VRLLDGEGRALRAVAQPSSPWAEAGGSAGTTANGTFRFAAGASGPEALQVTWKGAVTTLRVSR